MTLIERLTARLNAIRTILRTIPSILTKCFDPKVKGKVSEGKGEERKENKGK